jgi:hypothetical protein
MYSVSTPTWRVTGAHCASQIQAPFSQDDLQETETWRKLSNNELHSQHPSPDIIKILMRVIHSALTAILVHHHTFQHNCRKVLLYLFINIIQQMHLIVTGSCNIFKNMPLLHVSDPVGPSSGRTSDAIV